MAIAVLGLGAAGVIAMQKATLLGNTNARNLATATIIAQGWIERLRVDAQAWNEPALTPDLGDTKWMNTLLTAKVWTAPDELAVTAGATSVATPVGSPAADIMGADSFAGDGTAPAFCTQVRLTRFTQSPSTCVANALAAGDSNLCTLYRMIRLEVRVYWDKSMRQLDCKTALPTDYQLGRYGFVYMESGILENNSPL